MKLKQLLAKFNTTKPRTYLHWILYRTIFNRIKSCRNASVPAISKPKCRSKAKSKAISRAKSKAISKALSRAQSQANLPKSPSPELPTSDDLSLFITVKKRLKKLRRCNKSTTKKSKPENSPKFRVLSKPRTKQQKKYKNRNQKKCTRCTPERSVQHCIVPINSRYSKPAYWTPQKFVVNKENPRTLKEWLQERQFNPETSNIMINNKLLPHTIHEQTITRVCDILNTQQLKIRIISKTRGGSGSSITSTSSNVTDEQMATFESKKVVLSRLWNGISGTKLVYPSSSEVDSYRKYAWQYHRRYMKGAVFWLKCTENNNYVQQFNLLVTVVKSYALSQQNILLIDLDSMDIGFLSRTEANATRTHVQSQLTLLHFTITDVKPQHQQHYGHQHKAEFKHILEPSLPAPYAKQPPQQTTILPLMKQEKEHNTILSILSDTNNKHTDNANKNISNINLSTNNNQSNNNNNNNNNKIIIIITIIMHMFSVNRFKNRFVLGM